MLLLAGLGLAGGALAARVAELQLFFVPVSAAFLGLGYYFAYRSRAGTLRQRVTLWLATPLTVVFWALAFVAR